MTDTSAALKRLLKTVNIPPHEQPASQASQGDAASQIVGQIGGGNIIIIGGPVPNEALELILQAQAAKRER
jgi:hypothetical protein